MKKLVTLIATLALASTLGLAGCKKKEEAKTEPATEATKPAEPAATPPADPAATPAAPAGEPAAAAPAAGGDMPAECADYKAALEKLAACDKVPAQAKDAMKAGWTTWETSYNSAPAEAKAAMGAACKQAADGVKTTITAAGC